MWDTLTWPRYVLLCKQWSKWPPIVISSARLAGMGPSKESTAVKRELVATGDPDFPFLYEATDEEREVLKANFGV